VDEDTGSADVLSVGKGGTTTNLSPPSSGDTHGTYKEVLKRYPHFIMYGVDDDLYKSLEAKVGMHCLDV